MTEQDCALILLASGLSSRFGKTNKLLADLAGQPVIAHVLNILSGVDFNQRYVVVSQDDTALISYLSSHPYHLIPNPSPERGQGVSLSLAARRVTHDGHKKACLCLADMPFIDSEHIEKLLRASKESEIVKSSYSGHDMPPAIVSGKYLTRLTRLSGDMGGKSVIRQPESVAIPLSKIAAHDIDTPDDLTLARQYAGIG